MRGVRIEATGVFHPTRASLPARGGVIVSVDRRFNHLDPHRQQGVRTDGLICLNISHWRDSSVTEESASSAAV